MRFADRMKRLEGESAFDVLAKVKRLEAEGRDIVSFAIGEPDFDTPENVKRAGAEAIWENHTHYAPSAGIEPLRRAIAEHVGRARGLKIEPDEVVVTPGAKPVIFHAIMALVEPGDEVLYPNPGFPTYASVVKFAGGRAVPVPLVESKNFALDIDVIRDRISSRTKMIILNSPHNPTGGVLSQSDLEAIADLALKYDVTVLSDEIYSRLIYDAEFRSISQIPGMKDRTIILEGFSKIYAMTGWRIGYGVMNRDLAREMTRLVTNCESCTATFTQRAAIEALTGPQDACLAMVAEFKRRRDYIVESLNDIPGVSCRVPGGAFYTYPNVTGMCRNLGVKDSAELAERLLYEHGVAVLARTCFGPLNEGETEQYVRVCYATSMERIREGLARLQQAAKR